MGRAGKTIAGVSKRVAKFGAAMTLAAAAGFAFMIKRQLTLIDTLAKMSRGLGIGVAQLQALRLAGSLGGIATDKLDKSLKRITKSVSDANRGLSTAKDAFAAIGLNASDLENLAPDEIFKRVADAVQKAGNSTKTLGALMDLFGARVGVELINVLSKGSAGIEEIEQQVRDLGLEMTNIDAAKVEAANDAWTRFKSLLTGVAQKFTVGLAPILEAVVNKMIKWGSEGGRAGKAVTAAMQGAVAVAAIMARAVQGAMVAWQGLRVAILFTAKSLADIVLRWKELTTNAEDPAYVKAAQRFLELEGALRTAQKKLTDGFGDLGANTWAEQIKQSFKGIQEAAQKAAEETARNSDQFENLSVDIQEAASRMEKLKSAAARIFDATRTPLEKFAKKIKDLKDLIGEGLITKETFDRAAKNAQDALDSATPKAVKQAEQEARTGEFRTGVLSRLALGGGTTAVQRNSDRADKRREVLLKRIADRLDNPSPTILRFA